MNKPIPVIYREPRPTDIMKTISPDSTPTRHWLDISSMQRDPTAYPNPSIFSLQLESEFKKITSVRLVEAEIPNTEYNVRLDNSCFFICVEENCVEITFPEGDYDACKLVEVLGELIVDSGIAGVYTINIINGKLCIESDVEFTLQFKDTVCADKIVPNTNGAGYAVALAGACGQKGSARGLLGFGIDNYTAVLDPGDNLYKLCGPYKVNLLGEKILYLHISTDLERLALVESQSQGAREAFYRIPMNAAQNNIVFYTNYYNFLNSWVARTPLERIRKFNFKLLTRDGRVYDTEGLDWCCSLEVITDV